MTGEFRMAQCKMHRIGQATPRTMSAFMDWFVKQHGPRNLWVSEDSQLQDIINHAASAREELDRRRDWDNRKASAFYAWAARTSTSGSSEIS